LGGSAVHISEISRRLGLGLRHHSSILVGGGVLLGISGSGRRRVDRVSILHCLQHNVHQLGFAAAYR